MTKSAVCGLDINKRSHKLRLKKDADISVDGGGGFDA